MIGDETWKAATISKEEVFRVIARIYRVEGDRGRITLGQSARLLAIFTRRPVEECEAVIRDIAAQVTCAHTSSGGGK